MKSDDKHDVSNLGDITSAKTAWGELGKSTDAKSGKGASVNKSLVGPYKAADVSPTAEFAKKGTGGENDWARIKKLGEDHRLDVSFK